jgi:hypothetical protein
MNLGNGKLCYSGNKFLNQVKKFYIFFILIVVVVCIFQTRPMLADTFTNGLQKAAGPDGAGYPVAAEQANPGSFFVKMLGGVIAPMMTGVIGLILLSYGGYTWMMSRGEEAKVEKAKSLIINTIIALVILYSAFVIVQLILPLWYFVSMQV